MPTCPHVSKPADPTQFWADGQLHFRARDVGWIVSGVLALIACTASFWLIIKVRGARRWHAWMAD